MATINSNSDSVYIDMSESLELYDKKIINGRKEQFLYALCALDSEGLPVPLSRIELWLNGLVTGDVPTIEPQSRNEYFLKAILTGDTTNLPVPQSRVEMLLNKLANGDTDLSDCEPIQSRYEFLLSYLIKNGGIDGDIEYITYKIIDAFETLYATVEKPVKSLKLSGDTLVNCVLEDTENDDYTSFDKDYSGTSFTINGTSEGEIKSAILKGQTLVNVALTQYMTPSNNASINGETITLDLSRQWSLVEFSKDNTLLIPNEVYTCILYDVVGDTTNVNFSIQNASSTKLHLKDVGYEFKFTMGIGNNHTNRLCYVENLVATSGTVSFKMVLLKGDYTNVDIPYFTGMQSVKMPVLTTTGKNLIDKDKPVDG